MAISKASTRGLAAPALALALGLCGCGAQARIPAAGDSSPTKSVGQIAPADGTGAGFDWLRPRRPPPGWRVLRIANAAVMPYPAGWQRAAGDAGTATAVLRTADGLRGYLNLTPQQGDENLGNWGAFRLGHNAREGDRAVKALAVATNLRFRTGRGSCLRDSYATSTGARYIEIACLVAGPKVASVIVGAAPRRLWAPMAPLIERAISAVTT